MKPQIDALLSPLVGKAVETVTSAAFDLERDARARGGVAGALVSLAAGAVVEAGRDFSRIRAREEAVMARLRDAIASGASSIRVVSNEMDPTDYLTNRIVCANVAERLGAAVQIMEVGGAGLDAAHVTILIHDRAALKDADTEYFTRNATLYGAELAGKARDKAATMMRLLVR